MTQLSDLSRVGLVDLLVVGLVVATVVTALRRRRGVLGTVGSVIGTLALVWVASIAVTAWAPASVADAVRQSTFSTTFPTPTRALDDLHRLSSASATPR